MVLSVFFSPKKRLDHAFLDLAQDWGMLGLVLIPFQVMPREALYSETDPERQARSLLLVTGLEIFWKLTKRGIKLKS